MRTLLPLLLLTFLCTCAPPPEKAVEKDEMVPAASRHEWPREAPIKLILDSDTANEIDDLFAIAYLVTEGYPDFELIGLSSAQWFHVWSGDRTVYQSQELNEELLELTGRTDLPHPLGSDIIMGKTLGRLRPARQPRRPVHHRRSHGLERRREIGRDVHRCHHQPRLGHRLETGN